MPNGVLVAYATKYGATAEIAARMGRVLREAGLSADVIEATEVEDLKPYRAVILGSAVYMGRWRNGAVSFLRENMDALEGRRLWLFSSGPTAEGEPVELTEGWELPNTVEIMVESLKPEGVAVFHGALDPEKLSFFERWIVKNVKAPTGDFRDWEMIEAWAQEIAKSLEPVPSPA